MKSIHFKVPDEIWSKFFMLYPGKGERTTLLRRVVTLLIERRLGTPTEAEEVVDTIEESNYFLTGFVEGEEE